MSGKALVMFAALSAVLISPAQNEPEPKKPQPSTAASAPYIYLVEIANDKDQHYLNVHFETLANRKYTVQASDTLPATNWIDVLVAPVLPFGNHYIYTEKYTNFVKRYFRLKMQ